MHGHLGRAMREIIKWIRQEDTARPFLFLMQDPVLGNVKGLTRKLLDLNKAFSKVAAHKINIQKASSFPYTCTINLQRRKTIVIPLTVTSDTHKTKPKTLE